MTDLALLAVVAAALLGGLIGALLLPLFQLLRRPAANAPPTYRPPADRLDPDLRRHVEAVSSEWAAHRGHPEASFLAAGYLGDAAEDVQRRWGQRW